MSANVHDVAILSDLRYPGGTSASIAAEVRAQAAAGLSTVLVHVPSPHQSADLPFSPRIAALLRDGAAVLAAPGAAVAARLLVVRQPRIFTGDLAQVPAVTAGRTVMVLNQAPGDAAEPSRYYDVAAVRDRVHRYFGAAVEWAPISPQVRDAVLRAAPGTPLGADWHEIIDPAAWWTGRDGPLGGVPVIGRHGRADAVKWPRTREEILAAYPDSPHVRVRVLGGGDIAVRRLGYRPANWELLRFGTLAPEEFLRTIDVFVYFHDPELVEAFGRTVLEAMVAGVPVVVGAHFRPLFADAALYTTPAGVADVVTGLCADPARYRAVVARARAFAAERYGPAAHLARLAARGVPAGPPAASSTVAAAGASAAGASAAGAPAAGGAAVAPAPRRPARPAGRRRVLLVSDNGAGLGHLSRLMAIARRLPDGLEPVIATQSHGASVAHREGFLTEYVPSRSVLRLPRQRWGDFLRARLEHLIDLHRPAVVAVDSVPHDGIVAATASRPDPAWVWVRRPMWRRGAGLEWIARGDAFDGILEPGEYAAPADEGATVADRGSARCVDPITFLDRDELATPEQARAALGLAADRPAVLLQLGAGNINDIASPVARIARYLGDAGFQLVLAESAIATEPLPPVPGAHVVRLYPVSRYLRGVDLVVSASGYNSFHELLAFGVPAVFVPNRETGLDDQLARARFAAAAGSALSIEDVTGDEPERVLARAVRRDVREGLSRRCADTAFGNGAGAAARWLAELAGRTAPLGA